MYDTKTIQKVFANPESVEAQRFIVALADLLHAGWQESRKLLVDEKGEQVLNLDGSHRREDRFKPVKNDILFVAKYISSFTDFTVNEVKFFAECNPERINNILVQIEKVNSDPKRTIRYNEKTSMLECDIANRPNSELSMNLQNENLEAAKAAYIVNFHSMKKIKPFIDDYEYQRDNYNESIRLMIGFDMPRPDYNSPNYAEELKVYNEAYEKTMKKYIGFTEEKPKEGDKQALQEYYSRYRNACYNALPKPEDTSTRRIHFALFAAFSDIHEEWMKRNPADGPKKFTSEELEKMKAKGDGSYDWTMQHVSYDELTVPEQIKDIDHVSKLNDLVWKVARGQADLTKYEKSRELLASKGFFGNIKAVTDDRFER